MNQKSLFLVSALSLGSLMLAGCGNGGGSTATTPSEAPKAAEAPKGKTLKVALLTPGPVSDAGWSAMAYEGLQGIKADLGAEVANQVASDPAQIKDAMRTYAQGGYDLVFGHGYEYNEPGVAISKDFPNTVFVSSSGGKTSANAGAFRFYLEEGFYLAGVMAAKLSKTHTVGSVAAIKVPSIDSTIAAFEAGAKAGDPKIKIIPTVYQGAGFENDVAKAKQATESVIAQGADFVIHQANAAAQGVFDACKEKNVYALGSNADQNANPGGSVIASAVIVAKPAFVTLAKQVQSKTYKGAVTPFGMKDGAIDFVINPTLKAKVPADVVKLLDETKAGIVAGKVNVPKAQF